MLPIFTSKTQPETSLEFKPAHAIYIFDIHFLFIYVYMSTAIQSLMHVPLYLNLD